MDENDNLFREESLNSMAAGDNKRVFTTVPFPHPLLLVSAVVAFALGLALYLWLNGG